MKPYRNLILTFTLLSGLVIYITIRPNSQNLDKTKTPDEPLIQEIKKESRKQAPPPTTANLQKIQKVPQVTPSEFTENSRRVLAKLPTLETLKGLFSKEIHQTPRVLLQAGFEIGKLSEDLENNPQLRPQAIEFFERCAQGDDYAHTVRALCLHHLGELDSHAERQIQVPEYIRNLSGFIKS